MSAQSALKHVYLSVLATAGLGGAISVLGTVLTSRNTVKTEDLDLQRLRLTSSSAKVFQFHFHFQLNCNTTKPPLVAVGLTSPPAEIFTPMPIGADVSKPAFWL
jgi:hypothetical protein